MHNECHCYFSIFLNLFYYNYNYTIIKKNEIHGEFIVPRYIKLLIIIVQLPFFLSNKKSISLLVLG